MKIMNGNKLAIALTFILGACGINNNKNLLPQELETLESMGFSKNQIKKVPSYYSINNAIDFLLDSNVVQKNKIDLNLANLVAGSKPSSSLEGKIAQLCNMEIDTESARIALNYNDNNVKRAANWFFDHRPDKKEQYDFLLDSNVVQQNEIDLNLANIVGESKTSSSLEWKIAQLCNMGIDKESARIALYHNGNNVERAANWFEDNDHRPDEKEQSDFLPDSNVVQQNEIDLNLANIVGGSKPSSSLEGKIAQLRNIMGIDMESARKALNHNDDNVERAVNSFFDHRPDEKGQYDQINYESQYNKFIEDPSILPQGLILVKSI